MTIRQLIADLSAMSATDLYRAYDAAKVDAYSVFHNGTAMARLDAIAAEVGRRERAVLAAAR